MKDVRLMSDASELLPPQVCVELGDLNSLVITDMRNFSIGSFSLSVSVNKTYNLTEITIPFERFF